MTQLDKNRVQSDKVSHIILYTNFRTDSELISGQ